MRKQRKKKKGKIIFFKKRNERKKKEIETSEERRKREENMKEKHEENTKEKRGKIMVNTSSCKTILQADPLELAKWLEEKYLKMIQIAETEDAFQQNGMRLGILANTYSFLVSLLTYAQMSVREAKRNKLPKTEIEDCIDRRDAIKNYVEIIKMQYSAVSRMITVHIQTFDETKMSDSRYSPQRLE